MSTAIHPDGSIVVRLPTHTVHLDVRTKAIHLRAPTARDELGGSILESFPQSAVDRVRIIRSEDNLHHLFLELRSGRKLTLGDAPSHDIAMMTARVVADLTRCKIEISQGSTGLPGPSDSFSSGPTMNVNVSAFAKKKEAADPFEEPTGRLDYEAAKQVVAIDEAPTLPPGPAFPRLPKPEAAKPKDPSTAPRIVRGVPIIRGQVDTSDLVVPPARAVRPREAEDEDTQLSLSVGGRLVPVIEEDSWKSFAQESDPLLEDAFDMSGDAWGEQLPPAFAGSRHT